MIRRMFLSLALLALAVPAMAAGVAPGDKAPEFKGLVGTDGKEYSLADMKDAKVVVVVFTCNKCPVAIDYEDRFIEFTKKYKDKGVAFVAINCNVKSSGENLENMKARAEEKGFNFPYVFDKTGATSTAYGARKTPEIYVLDGNRAVQYTGAFDNNAAGDPSKLYVVDAVEAILAGKQPEVTQTKAVGCGIQN